MVPVDHVCHVARPGGGLFRTERDGHVVGRPVDRHRSRFGAGSEPDNLNPILGFAPDGASKIFDGLVSRDANLTLVPALAEQVPTPRRTG